CEFSSTPMPAKVYNLKHLRKVHSVPKDPSLGFDNLRSHNVFPPQWTVHNKDYI
uniref:Uncharacterized protein n=1 Tax=Aegilops tauschii subsp. strangulata TaxID=200361 RepID=A0A453MEM3_AEGTS